MTSRKPESFREFLRRMNDVQTTYDQLARWYWESKCERRQQGQSTVEKAAEKYIDKECDGCTRCDGSAKGGPLLLCVEFGILALRRAVLTARKAQKEKRNGK